MEKRYKKCDVDGHKIIIDNYCPYCYRHIEDETSELLRLELEEHGKEVSGLPVIQRPIDASYWLGRHEQDRDSQELIDWLKGLTKIAKELYPKEF